MDKNEVLEAYHCVFSAIETGDAIQEPDNHGVLITIEEALKKQLPVNAQETQELIEVEKICKCGAVNPLRAKYCMECGQNITGVMGRV